MLDRALTRTFANLATLVLVALVFTFPVHLVQAYLFRDVLAVQELAPDIATFPEARQVRGVSKGDFDTERVAFIVALAIDLLMVPLAYRAARRVMDVDATDGVPGVIDAWTHPGPMFRPSLPTGPLLVTLALGAATAMLVMSIGNMLADMASAGFSWVLYASTRAAAIALLVALVTGVAAAATDRTTKAPAASGKIDLY